MGSFRGMFTECNWISVDQFNSDDPKCTVFFLSHCHSDHMQGLDTDHFYQLMAGKFAVLYCHKISKILLSSEPSCERLLEHVVSKDYNQKFTVTAVCNDEDRKQLVPAPSADVIFLDAKHIPGSAMILFEFHNGLRLLYTGDYRLTKDDWTACDMLKDPLTSSGFKRLDALYFDSTFCRMGAENMPTLKKSCGLCVKMVREWLEKDPENKVLIWCGRYGHELLLRAIWDKLHIKSHVTMMKYRVYSKLDFLVDCITPVARDTRVHACSTKPIGMEEIFFESKQSMVVGRRGDINFKQKISTCWQCRPDHSNVRVIKPSAIWFLRRKEKKLLRPVRAYPNTTDKRSKDFIKNLMKYFRPYQSDGSLLMSSKLSVDGYTMITDVITLTNSSETLKRSETYKITDEDSIEVSDLNAFERAKIYKMIQITFRKFSIQ
uniref:DNA repair metallo-beta-lactamase domain-containing protein n=1 Tax=Setaria digitata TaxID=48799 RepID=A0A915PC94_9BILA